MSFRLTLRVAAPSIVISLLLLVVGSLGGWYVLRLQKRTASLVALDMATMRAAQELVLSITEVRSELAEFLATGDRVHLETIPAKCAQTALALHRTEELVDDDEEIALARRIREGFERFQAESEGSSRAPSDADARRAARRLNSELFAGAMLQPAKMLLAREEDLNRKSGDYNLGMANRIVLVLCLLAVCGSAAGLIAGVGIARSVTRSIVELYVPVRVASGKLEEVVGPVDIVPSAGIENLDVLLRRMAEDVGTVVDRLQQSQLEVLRTEQMAALGHLAAGLAHELRNPLTAMKVLIQKAARASRATKTAARDVPGGSPAALAAAPGLTDRDLAVLETETARLERSIQTFLDFARPPTLEQRPEDVRQAVRQTLELVRARADQQRVEVHCDLADRPLMVQADGEQLHQLFLNLLCNALDALPQGGDIWITAGYSPLPLGERTWITITLADSGPGIPPDLGDRIFDPYVSTKETGIGLGLAICRRIVQSHGGQISANNRSEGGAVFTVRLPAHVSSDQQGMPCPQCS